MNFVKIGRIFVIYYNEYLRKFLRIMYNNDYDAYYNFMHIGAKITFTVKMLYSLIHLNRL